MRTTPTAILALALLGCVLLTGCGEKMSDQKFSDVANTIYENVQANWDHQSGESWATYYERRIGEACAKHGTSPAAWDKKMAEVKEHPEKFEKVVDKDVLTALLQWEQQREDTKQG
jgi:hypothetical protein